MLFTITWFCLANIIQNVYEEKIAKAIVNHIHAFMILVLSYMYLNEPLEKTLNLMVIMSGSYYIYDVYQLIAYRGSLISKLSFLFHHVCMGYIFSILFTATEVFKRDTMTIIFYSEIGNQSLYMLYYLLHAKSPINKKLLFSAKIAQAMFYTFYRGLVNTYMIYSLYFNREDNISNTEYYAYVGGFLLQNVVYIWISIMWNNIYKEFRQNKLKVC